MAKRKPTRDDLLATIRSLVICKVWQPGMPTGDKPTGYYCRLCESQWKPRAKVKHRPECVLA